MLFLYILGGILALFVLYVLLLAVSALLVDPESEYDREDPFYRFLLNSATVLGIVLLRIRVHASGIERIPRDAKILFVENHRSNFDPIVTWYALKKWKMAFISKPENFRIPLFGRIIRKCCFLPIDRENPRNAIVTIQKAAALLEKGTLSVGVYPEGTRSKTRELLPFHNGVFKIAQKAGAPIVVLCISGTENISKNTPFRPTDVYLDVVGVFSGEEIKTAKTEQIGTMVRHLHVTNLIKRENVWQKDM